MISQLHPEQSLPTARPARCPFHERNARVGQVDSVEGRKAKVKAADGGHVYVELAGPPAFNTPFVEFQGVVTSPTSIREESRRDFGSNFGEISHIIPKIL